MLTRLIFAGPVTNVIYANDLLTYIACPPFKFKNTLSNTDLCESCPPFSNTTGNDTAVSVCQCDPGYYRTDSEDALPCTSKYTE